MTDHPITRSPDHGDISLPLSEQEAAKVIQIATTWLRTPYHPGARLRGVGVDCAQILVGVYSEAGYCPAIETGDYSIQVHLHKPTSEEAEREITRYVDTILQWAVEIPEAAAAPGDMVLYKVAYGYAHGAIVVEWPGRIIHAMRDRASSTFPGVIYSHGTEEGFVRKRPRRFFRVKHLPMTAIPPIPSHAS
jgi:cell wall-associated NlpC family hydrolase